MSEELIHRKYEKQEEVAYSVLQQIIDGNNDIVGIMLESYIHEGKQPFPKTLQERRDLIKGVSITDGCISLETTERVIRKCYDMLKKENVLNFLDDFFADIMIKPGIYKGHWQLYWDQKRKQENRKLLP